MTTRNGKIARLPFAIREELNHRLIENEPARSIAGWLNAHSTVRLFIDRLFEGRPITEQNISEWRKGGYEEWLAQRDVLSNVCDLTEKAARTAFTGISAETPSPRPHRQLRGVAPAPGNHPRDRVQPPADCPPASHENRPGHAPQRTERRPLGARPPAHRNPAREASRPVPDFLLLSSVHRQQRAPLLQVSVRSQGARIPAPASQPNTHSSRPRPSVGQWDAAITHNVTPSLSLQPLIRQRPRHSSRCRSVRLPFPCRFSPSGSWKLQIGLIHSMHRAAALPEPSRNAQRGSAYSALSRSANCMEAGASTLTA
jgi:hypothetical protein